MIERLDAEDAAAVAVLIGALLAFVGAWMLAPAVALLVAGGFLAWVGLRRLG